MGSRDREADTDRRLDPALRQFGSSCSKSILRSIVIFEHFDYDHEHERRFAEHEIGGQSRSIP
jgi:hypothetical protein